MFDYSNSTVVVMSLSMFISWIIMAAAISSLIGLLFGYWHWKPKK